MQKRAIYSRFTRALSMLLVLVMVFGMTPFGTGLISIANASTQMNSSWLTKDPLDGSDEWPKKVKMLLVEFPNGYHEADSRWTFPTQTLTGRTLPSMPGSSGLIEHFEVDFSGMPETAFCADYGMHLDVPDIGKEWTEQGYLPDDHPAKPFLDCYYTRIPVWGADPTEQYGEQSRSVSETWTQAVVWACESNPDHYKKIFDEVRTATDNGLAGHDGLTNPSTKWDEICPMLCELAMFRTGVMFQFWPALPQFAGKTKFPDDFTEADMAASELLMFQLVHAWLGYYPESVTQKFDYKYYGGPTSGHQRIITAYRDKKDVKDDEARLKLNKVYPEETIPGDDTVIIRKVDALTGEGVGIATFHFEGEADGTLGTPGSSSGMASGGSGSGSGSSGYKPLPGATFGIFNTDGEEIARGTTGSDGSLEIIVDDSPFNGSDSINVTVRELTAPSGFTLDPTVYTATLTLGELTYLNGGSPIVNTKAGSGGGTPDPGTTTPDPGTTTPDPGTTPGTADPGTTTPASAAVSLQTFTNDESLYATIDTTNPKNWTLYGSRISYETSDTPFAQSDDEAPLAASVENIINMFEEDLTNVEMSGNARIITAVALAESGPSVFELPIEGATGFATLNMTAGSISLTPGQAFTILEETASGGWKIKVGDQTGELAKSDVDACMINLPDVMPSIAYDITNAYSSVFKTLGGNITGITGTQLQDYSGKLTNPRFDGRSMYLVPLNYQVAQKVAQAQKLAQEKGQSLVIYDAFRPWKAQESVADAMNAMFAADATLKDKVLTDANGDKWALDWFISEDKSNHQMGYAIDCDLCTVTSSTDITVGDKTVSIPDTWTAGGAYSGMHELSAESAKYNKAGTAFSSGMESSASAKDLNDIMSAAGMVDLRSEWWHYQGWTNSGTPSKVQSITGDFSCNTCLSTAPDKAEEEGGTPAPGASGPGDPSGPTGGGDPSVSTGTGTGPTTGPGTGPTTGPGTGTGSGSGTFLPMPGGDVTGSDIARYIAADFQTDAQGRLNIQWWDPVGENYLPPGQYTVTETQAPLGYDLNCGPCEGVAHLVLKYDESTKLASMSGPLIFKNNRLRKLLLEKVDSDGNPIPGVVFNIYKDGQKQGQATTGPDGKIEWYGAENAGLENGYYEFEEVSVPLPYVLPYQTVQGVYVTSKTLHDNEILKLVFVNHKETDIEIFKVSESGIGLKGAVFEVEINGHNIGTFESDENGHIAITPDAYGLYVHPEDEDWDIAVREVSPPDGYLLDDDQWQHATAHRGTKMVPFYFKDTKYPEIKILKRDINHPEKMLAGATFTISVDGGESFDVTTGADGTVTIDYQTYGRFLKDNGTDELNFAVTVTEIRAPEGYLITNDKPVTKRVTRGDKLITFEFSDEEYPEIWVRKVDAETGQILEGMTFEMEIDGKKIGAQFTTVPPTEDNPEGWYKFRYEDLDRFLGDIGGLKLDERGYTVTVTEVLPPEHYNMDKQPGSVGGRSYTLQAQLQPGQEHITFTFKDNHYRSVKVRKVDSETGWGLKGATFRLWSDVLDAPLEDSAQGAISSVATTDEDGWAYFYNLPNGWYYLEETQAPIGYSLEDGEWEGGDAGLMDKGDTHNRITRFQITSDSGHSDVGPYGEPVDDVCQACAAHKEIRPTCNTLDDSNSHDHGGQVTFTTEDVGKRENIHWLEFRRKNEPITGIRILKRDITTNNPVAGAVFRITPQGNNPEESFTVTTNSEGVAIVENNTLKKGVYTIVEEYVPKPYVLDPTPHIITIDNQHDAFEVPLYNAAEGVLYIRKLDSVTGEPLAGAYFQITDGNGAIVGNGNSVGPTDASGYIMFSPLEPGQTYVVKEIRAPDHHELDPYPQTFTVPENVSSYVKELVFNNSPKANLWLKKVDAETGLPLQDAVFKITTADGAIVKQNAITDAEGYIKVNDLEPGTYFVEETSAPKGYMVLKEENQFIDMLIMEPWPPPTDFLLYKRYQCADADMVFLTAVAGWTGGSGYTSPGSVPLLGCAWGCWNCTVRKQNRAVRA